LAVRQGVADREITAQRYREAPLSAEAGLRHLHPYLISEFVAALMSAKVDAIRIAL
jgi:hypothetical protein